MYIIVVVVVVVVVTEGSELSSKPSYSWDSLVQQKIDSLDLVLLGLPEPTENRLFGSCTLGTA